MSNNRALNLNLQEGVTRYNSIRNLAVNSSFCILLGHGTGLDREFQVPPNVYVVYLSDPGYPLNSKIADEKWTSLLQNPEKFKEFLRGTLPRNEIPAQLLNRNWKWWQHVYQPNSMCPDLNISFGDDQNPYFDSIMGAYTAGVANREIHGTTLDVSQLCQVATTTLPGVNKFIFVMSCRTAGSTAASYQMPAVSSNFNRAGGRQNYSLPYAPETARARNLEETASRIASKKRSRVGMCTGGRCLRSRVNQISSRNNGSGLNFSGLNNRNKISNVVSMLRNIRSSNHNLQIIRQQYPQFFRGLSNANSIAIIRNIRSPNGSNINNIRVNILSLSRENINQLRVNTGPVQSRIIARLRNLGLT
jgi:hypothetical protein